MGETFRLYKGSFGVFVTIIFLAHIPFIVQALVPNQALFVVLTIAGIFLYVLASGATACAVASIYLGRDVNVKWCYLRAWERARSLWGSAIVLTVALLVSFITVVGIPLFFFLLVSWFFYVQAIMLEGRRGPREALGESRQLVKGSWWRIFGIGIGFFALLIVVNIAAIIPGAIVSTFNPLAGTLLISIAGAVATPISYIGATVVYCDLRARKEGYTLERMASESDI